jgi:hypothetical protein
VLAVKNAIRTFKEAKEIADEREKLLERRAYSIPTERAAHREARSRRRY